MTLPLKNRWFFVVALAAATLAFGLYRRSMTSSRFPPAQSLRVLETVADHVRNDYLEDVDPRRAMEGAFQGLIGALDGLSSYLDPAAAEKFAAPAGTAFHDVGAIVGKRPGTFPLVVGIVAGSPAEKAGIRTGDYLSAVDGRSTVGWSLTELRWALKDKSPTPLKIRLIRENDTRELTVERAPIYSVAISRTDEKGTSGVVKVHHLFPGAAAEFRGVLAPGLSSSADPLVLDLRECHEGGYEEAAAFANLFLKASAVGAFVKRDGAKETLACPAEPVAAAVPLVVRVGPGTMGPAELLAGVLREVRKAKIVGRPTPGLVGKQVLFRLDRGDALLLTTAAFVLTSGEPLLGKGITPDETVEPEPPPPDAR